MSTRSGSPKLMVDYLNADAISFVNALGGHWDIALSGRSSSRRPNLQNIMRSSPIVNSGAHLAVPTLTALARAQRSRRDFGTFITGIDWSSQARQTLEAWSRAGGLRLDRQTYRVLRRMCREHGIEASTRDNGEKRSCALRVPEWLGLLIQLALEEKEPAKGQPEERVRLTVELFGASALESMAALGGRRALEAVLAVALPWEWAPGAPFTRDLPPDPDERATHPRGAWEPPHRKV